MSIDDKNAIINNYSRLKYYNCEQDELRIGGVSISLLKKYMIHVEQCESVNFVSYIDNPWSKVEFTKEEIAYLQKLDKEIDESNEI